MSYKKYRKPNDTELTDLILSELHKYTYLQKNYLSQLLEGQVGEYYIRTKLQHMKEQGLIEVPDAQDIQDINTRFFIYSLTQRGIDLATEKGINPHIVANIKKRTPDQLRGEYSDADIRNDRFWHDMGIINTLASVKIYCKNNGLIFISEGEIKERYLKTFGKEMTLTIPFDFTWDGERFVGKRRPDFIFGITYPNGLTTFFIGEYERTNPITNKDFTRDGSSFVGKYIPYHHDILKNKTYKDIFGVPNLKLLFLTNNPTKMQHLIDEAVRIGKSDSILFSHISDQDRTKKSPKVFTDILTRHWSRAGYTPISLYDPEKYQNAS